MVDNDGNAVAAQRRDEFSGFFDRLGAVVVGLQRATAAAAAGTDDCGAGLSQGGRDTAAGPSRRPGNDRDATTQGVRIWTPIRHVTFRYHLSLSPKATGPLLAQPNGQHHRRRAAPLPAFGAREHLTSKKSARLTATACVSGPPSALLLCFPSEVESPPPPPPCLTLRARGSGRGRRRRRVWFECWRRHSSSRAASAVKVARASPVSRSHTFSVLSSEAETARRPSGLTATPLTQSEWPSSVRSSRPVSRSHTFSVLSSEAETARRPSGAHRHAIDSAEWPSSVRSSRPLSRSHTFSVLSIRSGNGTPPVRAHRHASDPGRVAFQRAQFAAAFQIPHLQRVVSRSGNGTPPVRRSPPRQ